MRAELESGQDSWEGRGIAVGVVRFMEGVGQGAKKGTESRAWGDV